MKQSECGHVDWTNSNLISCLASEHTSGWTLLFLPQQQPWRRLKPQQAGELPSSHIAHFPHASTTTPWSPPQPPKDEIPLEAKFSLIMMMVMMLSGLNFPNFKKLFVRVLILYSISKNKILLTKFSCADFPLSSSVVYKSWKIWIISQSRASCDSS